MALKMAISREYSECRAESPDGYHKIYQVQFDESGEGHVMIGVAGFADEQARRFTPAGRPVIFRNYSVKKDDFESISVDKDSLKTFRELRLTKAYKALKAFIPEFEKAEDC